MRAKINNTLLSGIQTSPTPYEINDTEICGFLLRVQPSGVKSYAVRYRIRGKQTRFVIGRTSEFTPAQARDEAKRILSSVNLGGDPSEIRQVRPDEKTFGAFIEQDYEPWLLANRKSAKATMARIRANFKKDLWGKKLADLNSWVVERWSMIGLKEGKRRVTINRDVSDLKSALSHAVEWGFLGASPLSKMKPLKVDSTPIIRYLNDAEENALRNAVESREEHLRTMRDNGNVWRRQRGYEEYPSLRDKNYVDYLTPAILVSMNTGLRQGELLTLAWTEVDIDRAVVTVRADKAKNSKVRHIPLNEEALQTLKDWQDDLGTTEGLVFPGKAGNRVTDIKTAWRRLLALAKIESFRWHDLRHHFASRLVMAGVDLNTVRELLGHGEIKTTLRYAHLAPEHKAAAVAKLARVA